ncbi:MAG: amino acid adenylation domain-containing protein, partial [Chloroflexi bacterium]|nr:amino acid adenylation domain-containing protein [Chloroflexota bacterium]
MMTDIAQRIATLSPAKRALLERYLQDQHTPPAATVTKRDPSAPLPLSFAQQRLWFLEQLQPGLTAYNNVSAMQLNGRLNVQVLQQSLSEILRRHESMRTTFTSINGEPQQVINPPSPFPLPLEDFSQSPTSQWTTIEQCVLIENQRPFDLAQDLMRRARLLRFGEEEHVLILTSHHIASDGWSSGIFWRELMTLYKAFLQGEQTPLPALPIQYADYAIWQRQRLQDANLDRLQDYWKTRLTDAPPLLQLPTDFPRPTAATFQGDRIRFQFSPTLTKALRILSRQANTTLYMTLLAAFQTLLYRYTGSADILVGTPTANRPLPELESLIGFFVNTLPLRTDLAGNPSFLDLLERVRQIALDAFAHQELPFERIVEKLQVERNLAYNPLVQVIFSLQNTPRTSFELPDLQVSQLTLPSQNVHFDLQMLMHETGDHLEGNCLYRTDLFEPATIQRLINSFEQLLTGIVAAPSRPLDEFDLLRQAEKAQLLVAWNATETPRPSQDHLHQSIEAQAAQTPTALAVVCNGQQLTYRQLNEQANQLAHYLIAQGVQPQVPIALCVERSLAMIIGLLAILKAGGAYVPLEPTHPAERLKQMCDDIQATIVLTNSQLALHFAAPDRQIVPLDQAWSAISQHSPQNPALDLPIDQLAYVLYTSGSTGKPKGVMIEHRQVINYVTAMLGELIPPGSSCAMLQPLTVDSSLTMLFPPLFSGGVLHLLSQEQALDARAIRDYFRNHTIDCLKIAPSHLAALQAIVDPAQLMPRRRLIIGGEASRWAWVKSLQEIAPAGCQVFNHYGPTETTVGVLTYQFPKANGATLPSAAKSPPVMTPLGRPIANTQIYILDNHLCPVPIGVEGELYIGGHNVGRGYLNRAELTDERFVPDPFRNGRLYRTGDRARYLPSGDVEFLGRLDGQVKLRGFRIELGEIEATLARHPAVRMAAVTLQAVNAEDQRLVAYVVATTEHAVQTELSEQLRSFLEEQLPAYMIPSAYVLL